MKIEYSLAASYIFLGLAIGMVIWLAGVKIISKEKAAAPVAASYCSIGCFRDCFCCGAPRAH